MEAHKRTFNVSNKHFSSAWFAASKFDASTQELLDFCKIDDCQDTDGFEKQHNRHASAKC